jgi:hypothetical protein
MRRSLHVDAALEPCGIEAAANQLVESAMIDSKGNLRKAEREVAFRRRVRELLR